MTGPLERGIYLASRSPRRRDLLSQIGVRYHLLLFRTRPGEGPDVDETPLAGESPSAYVERVARAKAESGWQRMMQRNLPQAPVLAADTTVALGTRILGKPTDRTHAAAILAELSGQTHQVLSAVALKQADWLESSLSVSDVRFKPRETRVAITGAGVVQELLIERAASRGLVGNICMGRVARVLPGMQSAFIEIGLERAAFLHVADIWEQRKANGEPAKPIEKILAEGEPLLVQVLKDPIGSKGARLSTQISIAGRMLVYLPQDPHIGISQKIEDESGRAALRDRDRKSTRLNSSHLVISY